ncbi:hypothetical protein G7046_g5286 [Stylonectria norvegica]|nr:hypothetical protein G7046_g5286 [Stylonectria norvegica]
MLVCLLGSLGERRLSPAGAACLCWACVWVVRAIPRAGPEQGQEAALQVAQRRGTTSDFQRSGCGGSVDGLDEDGDETAGEPTACKQHTQRRSCLRTVAYQEEGEGAIVGRFDLRRACIA